ncbi:hypothetical protein AB69_2548 [Escherichia coli 1-110-08_S1_C3]|nr:hypothetical protein AB69_2548 [Escherichia coli 1-110-08_S1_C3]
MPFARYFCIFINVGLGEAAKRDVGTGENQIPDMASFASGDGWMKLPNGKILQYGRGAVTPTLSTQTMRITFSIPFPKKADCAMLTHSGDGGAPLAGAVKEAISEVFSRQAWRKNPATSHAAAFRSAGDIWSTELCGTFASRTMYLDTTCARSLTDSS